ncbi:MAG: hypothetical protein GFH27_549291n229 [Chloroflexi bacterium AL-W]|nr:hypothetical protein [Chloroflexi bacterium AL-N1]NOK67303.1 hypothetical protein [Chloroflexi bacterium AL-N10]NOK75203.1 hypothetical protein [Chloroflexi bacterium AL-N5]NOK81991.1 hypothetical protein [Chloroflexi bacterium AL-W]NOK89836.1 hypothetical protein [Chloroflexi bacterium AL-N15]
MPHPLLRSFGLLFAVLLSISLMMPAVTIQAQDDSDGFVPNEVLVQLTPTTNLATVINQVSGLAPIPLDQFGTRPIYLLQITDGTSPEDKAESLRIIVGVIAAEPNYTGQTPEGRQRSSWFQGDRGGYTSQWAPTTLRLPEAHNQTRGGGMIVAVLDTGVDTDHPELQGKLVPGFDFVDFDNDPNEIGSQNQNIAYGHGTHVAGVIALVAPESQIMPVRVLDADGVGNVWVLLEGLKYAVNNGADVINLSLSFKRNSNILEEIVGEIACDDDDDDNGNGDDDDGCFGDDDDDDNGGGDDDDDNGGGDDDDDDNGGGDDDDDNGGGDDDDDNDNDNNRAVFTNVSSRQSNSTGYERNVERNAIVTDDDDDDDDDDDLVVPPTGVVVVAASGNSRSTVPEYPAGEGVRGLLAVSASTQQDELAPFSNRGNWVHVSAPGNQILSTVPDGEYGTWSGTSMAAPMVAGTAALVRSQNPNLFATQVTTQIQNSSRQICGVPKRIDAAAALGADPASSSLCTRYLAAIMR